MQEVYDKTWLAVAFYSSDCGLEFIVTNDFTDYLLLY